ncbi:MAG: hypothetical protein R3246_10560, partial [Acidimicrobiia bacterium]|nr:hypothetical protein [Acidimicrobiia bacterium]
GAVFALEASADGSKLFVGGEFTNVDGIPHTSGLVALDPQSGRIDPTWRASLEKRLVIGPPTVRNLEVDGGWLYVVGNFTNAVTFPNLSTVSVKNAIRVSTANGSLDTGWKPQVSGGAVWGVAVDSSRNRVYLAGKFTSVNGTPSSAWFHTVNTSNAASVPGLQPFTFIHPQRDQRDVVVAGDRVWVGGAQHYLQMLDATDLTLLRGYFTGNGPPPGSLSGGGDTQDIELVGGRIYTTCHCWMNDGAGSKLWEFVPGGVNRPLDHAYGNMAFDAATGDYISQFNSEPDDFGGVLGGWAIHGATDGCIWIGGDFITSGQPLPSGLMRQCPLDGVGANPPPITEPPADTTKPSTPTGVTAIERANQQVAISWNASSDNDAVAGYLVYRDGEPIIGTADTKLRYPEIPGVTHEWTVRAIDPSGNLSNMSASTGPFAIDVPAGYPSTYLHENFDPSAGVFSYSDDTFRGTSEPAYTEGVYDPTGGGIRGGAGVLIGGVDDNDIFGMSGGWSASFDLASPTALEVSFRTRMEIAPAYDLFPDIEYVEALVSHDGTLFGVPPNDYVVQIDGGCSTCSVSWKTYVLDLGVVPAGNHTITIGAYNNQKTTETESGQVAIDDVQIASPKPGVGLTNPTNGAVVSGVVTIGVGADDLEDAEGTLDVDVRINNGPWLPAAWDAGLGVYTRQWDTTPLPEGGATVEARAIDSDGNASATPVANVIVNNDNSAPIANIDVPSNGDTVAGTVTVRVNAIDSEDPQGTLDVDVNTGQGWKNATWNAVIQRYVYSWDTTQQSDGPKTVQARAIDSNGAQGIATSVGVTVENVDEAPFVTIATPQEGVTWSGHRKVRVNATDPEDPPGTLTVQV